MKRIYSALLVGFVAALTLLFAHQTAEGKDKRAIEKKDPFKGFKIIQGNSLRTGFIEKNPERKLDEEETPPVFVLDTPPLVIDAWTAHFPDTDGGAPDTFENESYLFVTPTPDLDNLTFCFALKVPRGGIPQQLAADIIIIPSNPRNGAFGGEDMPPRPANNLFIDDIQFLNPGPGNQAREVIAFVDFPLIENSIGTGAFDWFILVDFSALTAADDDNNGMPDVALEASSGSVILKTTSTLDQVGADVVDFFTGNASKVNVFEARGATPPARFAFPGNLPGEDSTTRPWAFVLQ